MLRSPKNPFQLQAGLQGHIFLIHEIVVTCLQIGLDADSDNRVSRWFNVHAFIQVSPILYPALIF